MYTLHVYNGMMGVILLTVELISLGSTASTYPLPGHLTMIKQGLTQQWDGESTHQCICMLMAKEKAHSGCILNYLKGSYNKITNRTVMWCMWGALLTMWGTCGMCAAMFTFDGPRVLGSSCLATGAATGWTVTKLKTSNRREDTTRDLNDTPLPPVVPLQPYRCLLMRQLDTAPSKQLSKRYLC